MRVDVMFEYIKGYIKIRSEKTNISIYESATVLLVKDTKEENEKIESVGASEDWLREEIKKYPEYNKGKVFRFVDPFNCG